MKDNKENDGKKPDFDDIESRTSSEPVKEDFKWGPFSFMRRMFFLDVDPLVNHGFKTRLEPGDVYPEPTVQATRLNSFFEPAWEKEQKKPNPDLRLTIWAGNLNTLLVTAVLYGVSQACSLAGPMLLQRIVAGISCLGSESAFPPGTITCEPRSTLYYYCLGLFLAPALQSLCENHCNFKMYVMGTRMRNSLMAAIYRKCLKLSSSSLQGESQGRVVTLMSNDAQKLQDAAYALHSIWGAPAIIMVVLALLWFQVGWATFVGLGVMLTLIPITGFLAAKLGSYRKNLMGWTDKRVGLMSEIINGIQMIKFYAWEAPFNVEVMKYRNNEADILRALAFWQGMFGVVLFVGPVVVAVFCFGSYSIAGNQLSPAAAYSALSYFSLLRFPLGFLPMLVTMVVNAMVALGRIQGFLLRKEVSDDEVQSRKGTPGEVIIQDGHFVWDEEAKDSVLKDINFEAKPGSLTMIVGSVGSGKSSILSALIGHMSHKSGTMSMGGDVAYVAQTSWIMNDTVQENILMGHDMDPDRYRLALKVAQLRQDLKILPNGDLTEIGDRGITLSGGQKQRVSVARAVYHNPDVYLLDDPLSAVDSHVGRAMFEQCIRGPMRSKTVILVTNALQYLPHADNILWMEGGVIKGQGTYNQLVDQGMNIAELAHMEDEEDQDQDTVKSKVVSGGAIGKTGNATETASGKRSSVDLKGRSLDKTVTLTRQATDSNRNLTGVEAREEGNIGWSVIWRYFKAGGGIPTISFIVTLFAFEQATRAYTDYWVGVWFSDRLGYGISPGWFYLGIYCVFGIGYAMLTFTRMLTFLYMCVRATVNLYRQLLDHVLALPKKFFDTNPSGRVLNRFSRDTDIMDSTLNQSLIQFSGCLAYVICDLIVIAIATTWFACAFPPLLVAYLLVQRYYIPTAREVQRIESITRSPIYAKFGEALQGVATIRAYRKQKHFTEVSYGLMEHNAQAYVTTKLTAAWLAMRLDIMGLLILTGTGALCIQGNINPGMAGLAILYALDLTRYLKFGTTMASQCETNFNSVERIVQYLEPETEAAAETSPQVLATMPKEWPQHGALQVTDLVMRYRPEMPLVLKGVSFRVHAGEKVGLVGRTGSGKSSIFLALFRMVEPEAGTVYIDGVDTRTLGLHHLRSKMSIIPQDPFLYKGTVRRNLDPLEKYSDPDLWEALELVGLKPAISILEEKLDYMVVDNGANFSLGQRQLFCLARAMLRKSRILMLDEATASVDLESDEKIQSAIRTAFKECTMLTIAHRLNTIMDSDLVVVLDDGKVLEDAEPEVLLQQDNGIFTGFVEQTGKSSARYLRSLASNASLARSKLSEMDLSSLSTQLTPPAKIYSPAGVATLHEGSDMECEGMLIPSLQLPQQSGQKQVMVSSLASPQVVDSSQQNDSAVAADVSPTAGISSSGSDVVEVPTADEDVLELKASDLSVQIQGKKN